MEFCRFCHATGSVILINCFELTDFEQKYPISVKSLFDCRNYLGNLFITGL